MRCIKCGKISERMLGPFCISCYIPKIFIKPISIKFCTRCNRYLLSGKWMHAKEVENVLCANIKRYVKGEYKEIRYIGDWKVQVVVEEYGTKVAFTREIPVYYENKTCIDCTRKASGYYEAIIQLRGDKKRVSRALKILRSCILRESFITNETITKNGYDMFVGDSKSALMCISHLRDTMKFSQTISRSLVGLKEGKRVYRTTYAIRF